MPPLSARERLRDSAEAQGRQAVPQDQEGVGYGATTAQGATGANGRPECMYNLPEISVPSPRRVEDVHCFIRAPGRLTKGGA